MAYIFKIFRRIENHELEFWQNKSNSRYGTIRATNRKDVDDMKRIATVDLKTGVPKYEENWEASFKPATVVTIKNDIKRMFE